MKGEITAEIKSSLLAGETANDLISSLRQKYSSVYNEDELKRLVYGETSLELRAKYKMWNLMLVTLISALGVLKILYILMVPSDGTSLFPLLVFAPLVNFYLAWQVFRFQRVGYGLVLFLLAASLSLSRIRSIQTAGWDLDSIPGVFSLANVFLGVGCAALSIFLLKRLFPKLTFMGKVREG